MSNNIEDKLKEYRRRKEAEVKLSHRKSIWERLFPEKLRSPNENVTVAREIAGNVLDCDQNQASIVNHAEEPELKSSSNQGPKITQKPYSRRKTESTESLKQVPHSKQSSSLLHNQTTPHEISSNDREFKWFLYFLKIVLWIVLYLLCLELEFGAVYIIFSAFYLIFTNFRNGQRKSWEPSAYSVFNPGCEAIDGTLKPEQFEKEIRYGF
ncbi:SAYSvFN domain-containing protein 1-like [Daphnia pulex]|uniref:SAYSvFN domain-containing protein 1-like n=1 Tax=Daphnia pulex TaxID=6669 RepID=UPI001EDD456C|nr:SAYSvFN domain-containing protein 1-like [Daphnia pulex]